MEDEQQDIPEMTVPVAMKGDDQVTLSGDLVALVENMSDKDLRGLVVQCFRHIVNVDKNVSALLEVFQGMASMMPGMAPGMAPRVSTPGGRPVHNGRVTSKAGLIV